ncbi:MAG: hypothetical protein HZB56_15335 [Deltaproteobacteria bacterium]|nr:hypothetical protein [Deltaproteobacteria bacterium]
MTPTLSRPAAVLMLAALLAAGAARADESSFRPYLVGSRAAGMGGAFTALADDGSGAWYNPGGLAFVKSSQLSIAGSVYGLVTGSYGDALGDGHDFKYSGIDTLPTATAAIWRLGGEGASADVFSVSVFVPDSVRVDDRDTLGSSQNAFFLTSQLQTVYAGLGWARRSGRLGFGVAVFGLLGTRLSQLDISAVSPTDPSQFASITARTDETTYGALGSAGLRWDPTDDLHLGLSVYSPAFGFGKRRFYFRGLVGPLGGGAAASQVVNETDLHASPWQPLRVQGGVAARFGALTVAADIQFLAARTVVDDGDTSFRSEIRRQAVVNASVGVEWLASGRFPVRAGFFTDRSAAPGLVAVPSGAADPNPTNTSLVHRMGGTFSVGVKSDHTSTDLGVCISGGSGDDLVPDNLDFSASKVSRSRQLLAYVFLGSAYQF